MFATQLQKRFRWKPSFEKFESFFPEFNVFQKSNFTKLDF